MSRPALTVFVFLTLLGFLFSSARASDSQAATELDAAFAKLNATTYRKRESVQGLAKAGMAAPMITEVSGDRSYTVVEMQLPQFGSYRQEQVRIGTRSAVRATAPGLLKKLEDSKRSLTVNSARALLQQIVSAAAAVQTGGISTVSLLRNIATASLTIKSTAEARTLLDKAASYYGTWQVVKSDDSEEDEDMPAMAADNPTLADSSAMASGMFAVTRETVAGKNLIKYVRRPSIPGMDTTAAFYSVVFVDAKTGYPTSEEMYVNGQKIMVTEYFDFGADLKIETPDCLK
jgi:outer membrane lipoprotein-sorting protein